MDMLCDFALNIEDIFKKIADDSGEFKSGYDKEYLYSQLDKHFEKELNIFNERGTKILYQIASKKFF